MSTQVYVSLGHFFYLPPPPCFCLPPLFCSPLVLLSLSMLLICSLETLTSPFFSAGWGWRGHTHTQRSLSHIVCTSVCACVCLCVCVIRGKDSSERRLVSAEQLNCHNTVRNTGPNADSPVSHWSVVLTSFCSDQIIDSKHIGLKSEMSLFQTPKQEKTPQQTAAGRFLCARQVGGAL